MYNLLGKIQILTSLFERENIPAQIESMDGITEILLLLKTLDFGFR
jgi:hypothetical protein